MTPRAVEEIETISNLLDRDRIFLRSVLQNQLFEEQERPLVRHLLSNLYQSLPGVLRSQFCTVRTLAVLHEVLDLKDLLEDRSGEDFFLDRE